MDIKSLSSQMTFDQIRESLAKLAQRQKFAIESVDKSDTDETPNYSPPDTLEDISRKLDQLQESYNRLAEYTASLEAFNSEFMKSPNFEIDMDDKIFDYNSAYAKTFIFTSDWFLKIPLSLDDKITLATRLLEKISKYCPSNLNTLQMIADRNPIMLDAITRKF